MTRFLKSYSIFCYCLITYQGTGDISECGDNDYERYNVNATFRYNNMSDGDYISLFKLVVVPMIKEFSPGIILGMTSFKKNRILDGLN